MKFLLFLFLYTPSAYSVEYQWWQTKYSAASVDRYPRQGTSGVREHPRKEYCRNKWKDADIYFKQFSDDPFVGCIDSFGNQSSVVTSLFHQGNSRFNFYLCQKKDFRI